LPTNILIKAGRKWGIEYASREAIEGRKRGRKIIDNFIQEVQRRPNEAAKE
jgi:hypothetical protein